MIPFMHPHRTTGRTAAGFALAAAVALAIPTTAPCADPAAPPPGFTAIFNGKDLSGWWGLSTEDPAVWMALPPEKLAEKRAESLADIAQHWRVENGELVNDGKGLYLSTDKNYGDFELLIEYKTVPKADSGIYLRGIPQVQIWDSTEEGGKWDRGADKGSGGLWNNSPGAPGKDPAVRADRPFGEWNAFRIVMVGERVSVWLNGKAVVEHARLESYFNRKKQPADQRPLPRVGPIELQTHGGEIRWRNVFLREIGAEEANRILATHADEGFTQVFNGCDLTGWTGATDNYTVDRGAIVCKPGKGGNLYTTEQYGDFVVRLEFKLPPGGNNGLAIRYPGKGGASYDGFCELQVIDDTHPKYNDPAYPKFYDLKPAQAHGSVYARIPAHRGYLRPTGEWNFQETTVQGTTITVELNGTRILETDVAQADPATFMYPVERFKGRDLRQGHFGFAGHNDPVAFRAVRIRKLD